MTAIRGWTRVTVVGMAAMALAALVPAGEARAGELERPRRVVVTVDGRKTMDVEVIWWDQTGLMTAEHLKMRWKDMPAPDAWHLCAQLIDVDSAEDWLTMAKALSKLPDGKEWSRRAAHWSFWLSAQTTVDAGKLMKEMGGPVDPKVMAPLPAGAAGEAPAGPADAVHPEDADQPDDWPHARPWPPLTEQEQADAVTALKAEMSKLEDGLKVKFNLAENDYFLFYTDMPLADVSDLMEGVNSTYASLLKTFKLPEDQNLFWGKCVIIHCGTYELFSNVQRRAFRSGAVRHMGGMTHRRGQKVHVVTWQYPDEAKMRATIPHELVHAFLARYRTPREMPLWLEEGLADYMASMVMIDSPLDAERRPAGEAFIKTFGPVNALLDMRCLHDGWPGPRNAGYAVGYLLVKWMFEHNPTGTLACITAIKDGKPWEQALQEDYGTSRDDLVLQLVSQYRKPFKKPGAIKPPGPSEPAQP